MCTTNLFTVVAETFAEDESEDQEVVKLQEKSSTLKKIVVLMEEGLKSAARDVSKLQESIKTLEFQYEYAQVPEFISFIASPEGRDRESRTMQSTVMTLAKATLLISKPGVLHGENSEGRAATDAIVGEIKKSIADLYAKIGVAFLRSRYAHRSC